MQNRQSKGGRFAGAGLRLANYILPVDHNGNKGGLDRGGRGVAQIGYSLNQLRVQAQFRKIVCHFRLL